MFNWISALPELLISLIPHLYTVNKNEGAIKFSRGKKAVELKPGIHWYWPVVTEEPDSVNITRDSNAYATQKLTTSDGRRVGVSLVVVFQIVDVMKALAKTADYESTMSDIAGAAMTKAILSRTWDDVLLHCQDGTLREELLGVVSDELADYGILALDVRIKDCVETMVIALVGDGFLTGAAGGEE